MELERIDATPDHLNLVALTPQDVPGQQAQLTAWCDRQIRLLSQEQSDFLDTARIAQERGLKYTNFYAAADRVGKRITYYEKMRAAVEAGFLIVPNFDVEVMAVRVKRALPSRKTRSESSEYGQPGEPRMPEIKPQLLPAGEGRYVDAQPMVEVERASRQNDKGKTVQEVWSTAVDFDEPDFPVLAIKPAVMDATTRAMSLKIFDRIGVVTGRKEDPVVVGQLIDPRGGLGGDWGRPSKIVSFFIAWWLDTRSL